MTFRFIIDGAESGVTLDTEHPPERMWNGWQVPLATEQEFRTYAQAVADADRNANLHPSVVSATDTTLVVGRTDSDDPNDTDVWLVAGRTRDGIPVYQLDGWCWVETTDTDAQEG